jgi:hypothetical protein
VRPGSAVSIRVRIWPVASAAEERLVYGGSLSRWVKPTPLQLVHKFVDCRTSQDVITVSRVVPATETEMLKESRHPDRSQCPDQRVYAGASQFRECRGSAVKRLYRVHGSHPTPFRRTYCVLNATSPDHRSTAREMQVQIAFVRGGEGNLGDR